MTIPARIARLPKDARGYPIPWNVEADVDGKPIFTVNDSVKACRALMEGLCPICGEKLGRWKWFIGGPGSAFDPNGWYIDLPAHYECAAFALATCPYLAMPRYLGRIDVPDPRKLRPEVIALLNPTMLPDRPEVFVAVAGAEVEVNLHGVPLPYVRPARPFLAYEFWQHGKQIPVDLAMPTLRAIFGAEWQLPEVRDE